jgi:CelD/BcsL family acetyltransferase involved in cellulose biosynthesis
VPTIDPHELSDGGMQALPQPARTSDGDELTLERWNDTPAARAEWDDIAHRLGNVFATVEWNMTWWRHWGKPGSWLVTECRRPNGELAAVLPLYMAARKPLRVLRFLGHGPADLLGPICAPEDRDPTAAALRRFLAVAGVRWDLLVGQQMPVVAGWADALGGTVVRREQSPTLALDWPTWDDYLATRSSHFRKQVRRQERRLAQQHDLRFRLTTSRATLEADMNILFALHDARWRDDASPALAGARRAFHREFAAHAFERGWLRLWFLELHGESVAAWYGFRLGEVESYYQGGWHPAWDRWSVGAVLVAHTVRSALEDGMREYRFLRGREAYKDRFTEDAGGLETFVISDGVRGRAAAAIVRAAARRSSSSGPLAALRRVAGLGNA